jgi:murein DD-endopeptidase
MNTHTQLPRAVRGGCGLSSAGMKQLWPLAVVLTTLATQVNLARAPESSLPIEVSVPSAPIPVRGAAASHLFYELHLTNFSAMPLELVRVEVHASKAEGGLLASYSGPELAERLVRPGMPRDLPDKRTLGGGLRAVLMLHLQFDGSRPVPVQLWHRLAFADGTIDAGRSPVTSRPLVIYPPLRGGDWLAANGPANDSVHRRALLVIDGVPRIAQRLAIDWIKLGLDGRPAHDDRSSNENWVGYGEEVLAVADGTVVATKDGIPENVPMTEKRAVPITLDTLGGNLVVLDIGHGRYATFAHLIPKSVRVSVGAKLRRGQVLGLLGNSGNSDAPHLHFHITDGRSPFGSEGLPFVFNSMRFRGSFASLDELLGGRPWLPQVSTVVRTGEIPLDNAVIRFP